ncbi:MAG: hypothetical protein AAF721_24570 [Myxococcota bacterium]
MDTRGRRHYTTIVAEPAMRSTVERAFIGLLAELPREMHRRLETRCDPDHYRAARDAGVLGWVPLLHVVGLREALRDVVGDDDQFVALIKDRALLSVSRPPFSVLSAAILRIYRREPTSLLRGYERIWNSIFRGAGGYAVEPVAPDHARVVVQGPSPEVREPAFCLYSLGVFLAVVEIGGGTRAKGEHRVRERRVEFELSWHPEGDDGGP